MKVFDFQCKKGHVHEAFVHSHEDRLCPVCKSNSSKIISATKSILDPISGSFPGATMKWAKDRERKIKHERKVANS